jgi:hypothetical protein
LWHEHPGYRVSPQMNTDGTRIHQNSFAHL